jgi:hypothetical protein
MWRFESKKIKDAFHRAYYNQYSKCLGLLDKNYNIFRIVQMGGNCMVEKYLMKLKNLNL